MALDLPRPAPAPTHSDARVPPRPAPPPPARRRPRRPVLVGGFLLVLAVACGSALRVGGGGDAPTRSERLADPTTTTGAPAAAVGSTFAALVGDTTGCQTLAGAEPELLCPVPDGVVEYTQVANPMTAYRRVAGADDRVAARGDAACETGRPDERAWARPLAPADTAGRYLCRVEAGRAEIWWTVDDAGLLGHAFRRDDDLVALFSWWRAHAELAPDHP